MSNSLNVEAFQIPPSVTTSKSPGNVSLHFGGSDSKSTVPTPPVKIGLRSRLPKASEHQYLADVISRSFATSTFDTQERTYLPEPCIRGQPTPPVIEGLVTEHTVAKEFQRAPSYARYEQDERQYLVSWTVEHASKVFAITVQCHLDPEYLFHSMLNFLNTNFTDERLPIDDPRAPDPRSSRPPRVDAFDADIWIDQRHDDFFARQWTCLAPVFIPTRYEYDLPNQCILPFQQDSTEPRSGSFSSVFKMIVNKDHQQRHQSCEVAIKQIRVQKSSGPQETEKAWDIEARALNAINLLDHPHIMRSIAAIRRGEGRYFMFPWAENSLRDHWNLTPKQSPSAELIRQAIAQVRGLADGLDRLHNFQGWQIPQVDEYREGPVTVDGPQMDDDENVNDYRNPLSKQSIRHGDLKPENILRFTDNQSELGTLKIGDMGLAKRHVNLTEQRNKTSMRYGTRRYEAPETVTELQGRSRLYDLWSMGCITFELIIWILYGNNALATFYDQAEKASSPSDFQYYHVRERAGQRIPEVHPFVIKWMDHLQEHDPECRHDSTSAMKDLLKIVREKLLVVPLPPTRGSTIAGARGLGAPELGGGPRRFRSTASEFRAALDDIQRKSIDTQYLYSDKDRTNVPLPAPPAAYRVTLDTRSAHLSNTNGHFDSKISIVPTGVMSRPIRANYALPPMEQWQFEVDNDFAGLAIQHLQAEKTLQHPSVPTILCQRCSKLSFWSSGFDIEENAADLEESAKSCDFCRLLHNASIRANRPESEVVRFERNQSIITMTGSSFPVLSIFRSPELVTPIAIQIGRPDLPQLESTSSSAFFGLAKEWLKNCDEKHAGCRAKLNHELPTRLIDVGTLDRPNLRLVETKLEKTSSPYYIALSHPWGNTTTYQPFVTLRKDESGTGHDIDNFRNSIPYQDLPKTFRHAVDCTRKLGIQYLWIDSICIIQGPDGDFPDEAKRMEEVYSGAYCVIAASRASSQEDGFLGSRPQRQYVTFQPEKPFYVCETIDHFNEDVIMGPLNQRGWVLQERALARRTMYFTDKQTYFECGNGVRCETLTRMHNNMADLLGDSSFPDKAMNSRSRGLQIEYFQGLYKQYSRLAFTRWTDRPIAIAGLEKRLQKAFHTRGRHGIFDDGDKPDTSLFHRSLLWRREWNALQNKDGEPLEPIAFDTVNPKDEHHVPSWSWMAYKGGIDYTDPPFDSAHWETKDLIPPWSRGGYQDPELSTQSSSPNPKPSPMKKERISLAAQARPFNLAGRKPEEVKIAYDTDQGTYGKPVQCVIVARSKDARRDTERRFYVLLVVPLHGALKYGAVGSSGGDDGNKGRNEGGKGESESDDEAKKKRKPFQRVGAGFMLGKFIELEGPGVDVRIY